MSVQTNPKREHHIPPRLYLKGFVEQIGSPYIWLYQKGLPYQPDSTTERNPVRDSISKRRRAVGVKRDYYAFPKDDGEMDYDSYENFLEQLEKPANEIFTKIRNHKALDLSEKRVFADYISQMIRRVPKFRKSVGESIPGIVASFEGSEKLLQMLPGPDCAEKRAHLKKLLEMVAQREGITVQTHLKVIEQVPNSAIPGVLEQMTWRFCIAPAGSAFLTGDNPVFYFNWLGLEKNDSEVSFPVSTDVALIASRRDGWKDGFYKANSQLVKEINRRTISNASDEIYFSRSEEWVTNLARKETHRFTLVR